MILAEIVERSREDGVKPLMMSLDSASFETKNEETGMVKSSLAVVSKEYGDAFRQSRKLDVASAMDFGLTKEEIDLLNLDNDKTDEPDDGLEF